MFRRITTTFLLTTALALPALPHTPASAQTPGGPDTTIPDTTAPATGTASATTDPTLPATTPTTTTTPTTATNDPFARLRDRYTTLATALVAGQTLATGATLTDVLGTNSPTWDAAFGAPGLFSATTFDELNTKLAGYTLGAQPGADGPTFPSWDQMMASLTTTAGTPDGQLIAQTIDFGRNVGGLTTPSLTMPALGPAATIATAQGDEMMFGLFANQTAAQTLLNAPDIIGTISKNGTLDAAGQQRFQQQMAAAGRAVNTSLGNALPSPCYAAMLTAMGTGSTAAASGLGVPRDCTPCITAGAYMHGRMSELISPQGFTTNGTSDGRITNYEWSRLDATTRNAILALNPNLAAQLEQAKAGASTQAGVLNANANACSTSAAGTSNFLGSNLGNVLSKLGS